jgi:hypothetical protein
VREYRFRFERSEDRTLRVDLHDENGPLLQTSVGGTLHPLDPPPCAAPSSALL